MHIVAIPAYGRDYKSKKAVLEDWKAGNDFLIQTIGLGGYINKEDFDKMMQSGDSIEIRYAKLTKLVVIDK